MILRLSFLAAPALVLLSGCEDIMGGTLGAGATGVDTAATTPGGIQAAQLATPSQAGECEQLALTIEDSQSTEVARQAAAAERARIGCP